MNIRTTDVDHEERISDLWRQPSHVRDKRVGKDILPDTEKNSAGHRLREYQCRCGERAVSSSEDSLHGDDGLLDTETDPCADQDKGCDPAAALAGIL